MIHEATRTLVKSPPELWEQCSDPDSLARHLNGSFGEIRITRLEPETAVAWEGEHASGTVKIEPSAWGTRVTLTAEVEDPGEVETTPEAVPQTAPEGVPEAGSPVEVPEQVQPEVAEPEPAPTLETPSPEIAIEGPRPRADRFASFFARFKARFRPPPPVVVPEPEVVNSELVVDAVEEALPSPRGESDAVAEPAPEPPSAEHRSAEPPPPPLAAPPSAAPSADAAAALNAGLDSLGQAHHRPYSRA